jgi:sialidase-1
MLGWIVYWFSILLFATGRTAPLGSVVVFEKGEGGYYCHKIPYLTRTHNNALLAFAEARGGAGREACDDFSGTDLVYKRSEDGGNTWSTLKVLYSNSSTDGSEVNIIGNAAPIVDSQNGRIVVPFCKNNEEVWLTSSDDDGLSWKIPSLVSSVVLPEWKWVGLGPPGGLELASGRFLVPGYHTVKVKGDGEISKGHTLISDDRGKSWYIGASDIGAPFLFNENQAVQLNDGRILINARVVSRHRVQVLSDDEGLSFSTPVVPSGLTETIEGCEGSLLQWSEEGSNKDKLYFSNPNNPALIRRNMTVFTSHDEGASWSVLKQIDAGAVSYSALVVHSGDLTILYERSNEFNVVFEPDEIVFYRIGHL